MNKANNSKHCIIYAGVERVDHVVQAMLRVLIAFLS